MFACPDGLVPVSMIMMSVTLMFEIVLELCMGPSHIPVLGMVCISLGIYPWSCRIFISVCMKDRAYLIGTEWFDTMATLDHVFS